MLTFPSPEYTSSSGTLCVCKRALRRHRGDSATTVYCCKLLALSRRGGRGRGVREARMPKKKRDPSDIHRTHGVGDTPEYVERSKLAAERLDLKRRLVADRREEEQQARRLTLPKDLEAQAQALADRSVAARKVAGGVDSRHASGRAGPSMSRTTTRTAASQGRARAH